MNLFQNVMISQRELCLCNFHIIYKFLNDPEGQAFASSCVPCSGEFANFILKNANAQVLAQGKWGMCSDGIDWWIMAAKKGLQKLFQNCVQTQIYLRTGSCISVHHWVVVHVGSLENTKEVLELLEVIAKSDLSFSSVLQTCQH